MTSRRLRLAAAIVAIAYIAIQGFQEWVFRVLPEPHTPGEALVAGGDPLNVARSTAMLAAMFGLVFLYAVVSLQRARERPVLAGFTFLAFFLFGLLEIGLRSVELIWTQLELPAGGAASLDKLATFEAVQHALYLPLGFAVLLGSVLAVCLFASGRKLDRIAQAVFALDALRTLGRQLTVYAGVEVFPAHAYEVLYFPLVVAFYAPLAYWLVRRM